MKAAFLDEGGNPAEPYSVFHVQYVDAKVDRLDRRVRCYSAVADQVFELPAGDESDGRSVPWWTGVGFVLYGGRNSPAAWVHDHLYRTGKVPRDMADAVFRELLLVEGERPTAAAVMFGAVRTFGFVPYGNYRKKDGQVSPSVDDVDDLDHSPGA